MIIHFSNIANRYPKSKIGTAIFNNFVWHQKLTRFLGGTNKIFVDSTNQTNGEGE